MNPTRRQSVLSQTTESSSEVRSPLSEDNRYRPQTALLGLHLVSPPNNPGYDRLSSDPSSILSPFLQPSRTVEPNPQQDYHMRMRQANSQAMWNSAISVSQRQRAQMQMRLPALGRRGTAKAAQAHRATSPYRSRTDSYRLRMRDAAAASLWTAWQDTSLSMGEERTRHIFTASRRLS